MASLADQISKLISPAPVFHDPEDVVDESGAKVLEKDTHDDDSTGKHSKLRKKNVKLLADEDSKYAGKRVTRKSLELSRTGSSKGFGNSEEDDEQSSDDEDEDDEEDEDSEELNDEDDEESDGKDSSEEDDELKAFKTKIKMTEKSDKKQKSFSFDKDKDLGEYGESESDDDIEDDDADEYDEYDDSDGSDDMETDEDEDAESEDDEDDDESEVEDEVEEETDGVQNFSKSSIEDDKKKGEAVRCQLGFYDSLLKGRIEMQKVLAAANQLPQPDKWNEFMDAASETYKKGVREAQTSLHQLLSQILELQTTLYQQNPETAFMQGESSAEPSKQQNKDDDEITSDSEVEEEDKEEPKEKKEDQKHASRKRKLRHQEMPELLAKRHKLFKPYRNEIIQKWYDKTRVASGKLSKGFSAFEQSALKQIDQIMSDKERIIKRTQLKRSGYRILGKPEEEEEDEEEKRQRELEGTSKGRDTKSYDEEIFDDDDFYHQLLRELIERKTSDISDPVALSRQWLEIQKLRNKVKKKVDTKASKGRKIRYHIHPRLVNFMAPVAVDTWTEEAKDDLFTSLFGQTKKNPTEKQS